MKTAFFLFSFMSFLAHADIPDYQAIDRDEVPEVAQGYYIVATADEFPAIQTYGLATCIGVTLYDPVRKQGALLHVSAATNISAAVQQALNDMEINGSQRANITAQMYGGWGPSMDEAGIHYTSDIMVSQLFNEFANQEIQVVRNSTLLTREALEQGAAAIINIELDLSTGLVYQYVQSVPYVRGDISRPMPEN